MRVMAGDATFPCHWLGIHRNRATQAMARTVQFLRVQLLPDLSAILTNRPPGQIMISVLVSRYW